jgi:choline kinase
MNTVEKRKHKQQHQELLRIRNRYIIEWSTKKLKTIRDFYVALGHNTQVLDCYYPCPAQLEQPLTREYIVNMFELERQALDRV